MTDSRLAMQRPTSRVFSPTFQTVGEATLPRAVARRRDFAIPSWVVFCMIMMATFAVCVTVTMRTHAEMSSAEQKYELINTDVAKVRNANASLKNQLENLRTDPRSIESAARARLNMSRINEIIVPLE